MPSKVPYMALRVFVAVAESLSFKEAAHTLSTTPSNIGAHIRSLESALEKKLFVRQRGLTKITRIGEAMYQALAPQLQALEQNYEALRGEYLGGAIRVSVLPSLLRSWISPRLSTYSQPESLSFIASPRVGGLDEGAYDVAIRLVRESWPDCDCVKLYDEYLVPIANHSPSSNDENFEEQLESSTFVVRDMAIAKTWASAHGLSLPKARVLLTDSTSVVRYVLGAQNSRTIGLARGLLAHQSILSGRLRAFDGFSSLTDYAYCLFARPGDLTSRRLSPFVDWLKNEASKLREPRTVSRIEFPTLSFDTNSGAYHFSHRTKNRAASLEMQ